jgi:hypothetical protein
MSDNIRNNPCANKNTTGCEKFVLQRGTIFCDNCIENQKTISRSRSEKEFEIEVVDKNKTSNIEQVKEELKKIQNNLHIEFEKAREETDNVRKDNEYLRNELNRINNEYKSEKENIFMNLISSISGINNLIKNQTNSEITTIINEFTTYTESRLLKEIKNLKDHNSVLLLENENLKCELENKLREFNYTTQTKDNRIDDLHNNITSVQAELVKSHNDLDKLREELVSFHNIHTKSREELVEVQTELDLLRKLGSDNQYELLHEIKTKLDENDGKVLKENTELKQRLETVTKEKTDSVIYTIQLEKENAKLYEMINISKTENEKLFQELEFYRLKLEQQK